MTPFEILIKLQLGIPNTGGDEARTVISPGGEVGFGGDKVFLSAICLWNLVFL